MAVRVAGGEVKAIEVARAVVGKVVQAVVMARARARAHSVEMGSEVS